MIWFLFALMLGTMLIGVPILLAIALVGYVGVAATDLVLPLFAQKMFAQLDSFTLLALPYFILAGGLMSASGMSQQLVDFSRVLVGHLRAGLAHAAVVASMIFAGISGSSTADASAISAIVIPTMKRSGYKAGFAAALIATSGTIGAIIPPSMVMVVYGAIAQVSIGGLFLGGIVPGILVGLFLMAHDQDLHLPARLPRAARGARPLRVGRAAALDARGVAGADGAGDHRRRHPVAASSPPPKPARWPACMRCCWACSYYRKIKLRDLPGILVESAVMTTMVSGIIAVAGASGWLLSYLEFNDGAVKFVTSFSQNPTMVLLIVAIVMIVLGTFVDSLAVLLIFAPVAIQISKTYGIDPFQMGLVMVMCNQIGAVSPPTAPLLFITTSIAQATLQRGQQACLVVHAGRDAGAVAGDLRPRAWRRGFRTTSG